MSVEPPSTHRHRDRGRMAAPGGRNDGGMCTPLVLHENDDSWSFHGLGAPDVKVSRPDATAITQGILRSVT